MVSLKKEDILHYHYIVNNKWKDCSELDSWLSRNGYDFVSSGTFSKIWSVPDSNYVIKVGRDVFIESFVKTCNEIKDVHLPIFSGFTKIGGHKNNFFVFMEKLNDFTTSEFFCKKLRDYSYFILEYVKDNEFIDYRVSVREFFEGERSIRTFFTKSKRKSAAYKTDIEKIENLKEEDIVALFKTVYKLTTKLKLHLDDIGGNNLMLREDKKIVFNDPVYGSDG